MRCRPVFAAAPRVVSRSLSRRRRRRTATTGTRHKPIADIDVFSRSSSSRRRRRRRRGETEQHFSGSIVEWPTAHYERESEREQQQRR